MIFWKSDIGVEGGSDRVVDRVKTTYIHKYNLGEWTRNMSAQDRTIKMYDGRVYDIKVSNYGLENGYLDYRTLSKLIGVCMLNNTIMEATKYEDWELVYGHNWYEDEDEDIVHYEIFQYYIISEIGANVLERYTDEIVYYNSELDIWLWGVTHCGTGWDYVLTDIKLVNED